MTGEEQPQRTIIIPADVSSAVTPAESYALAALCRDQDVLELGAYHGFSTVVIASVAARVTSVDWHQGDDMAGVGDTWDAYWNTIHRYGVADRVVSVRERFETALPRLRQEGAVFDGVFLDAHHSAESVMADIELALPLVRAGGFMAFHDYGRSEATGNPGFGVTGVVDAMPLTGFGQVGYLAWGRLPAGTPEPPS